MDTIQQQEYYIIDVSSLCQCTVIVCVISSKFEHSHYGSLKVALGQEQVDSVLTGAAGCGHEWQ